VTGCSATSAAPAAGNIVSSLLIQLTFKFGKKDSKCSKRGHQHIIEIRYVYFISFTLHFTAQSFYSSINFAGYVALSGRKTNGTVEKAVFV
jgi:hypothetical protein